MKTILISFSLLLTSITLSAQGFTVPNPTTKHTHNHHHGHNHGHQHQAGQADASVPVIPIAPESSGVSMVKNLNQWHKNVAYKARLGGLSDVYLEQKAFTYVFSHAEDVSLMHEAAHNSDMELNIRSHAYKVHFNNAQEVVFEEHGKHQEIYNFFLGNDPNKWASEVPVFEKVGYKNLYPGIDLETYSYNTLFKYDFIVAPHVDPSIIEMEYEGADALEIDNDHLVIQTSVETIIEQKPFAYQMIKGYRVIIPCEYQLEGNKVSFVFPKGYDKNYELVIDPTVVAATLSGMVLNQSFGHSATFDNQGNIYASGRAFGIGYQATSGAFQTAFSQGSINSSATDIAVTKYNPNGSAQIYATYIGGTEVDVPHSMITDFNGQLYILGTSTSADYPTTSNAVQPQKRGTTGVQGTNDIVITKLNTNGSALVGSTFLGGSNDDGINKSILNDNYDDQFRGEIVLDNQGNAYIASCTNSSDFPVTPGAFDTNFNNSGLGIDNPAQDAVVFKLNNDFSTLFWSTYLGGDHSDTAFGLRVDDFGRTYVTGIAGDSNFPTTSGTVQPNWPGGQESGYVSILNASGSDLIASTFWGSSGNEHSYFLDIDEDGNVHIYGQTTGSMPITPNTYFFNANSRQFLSAFNSNLTSTLYSTVVGTGPNPTTPQSYGDYDFVPVAFMVDKCNNIYFSGYYANFGLPTTADAVSTVGGTVYLGVLDPLATSLQFSTYYGNANHVDGGTSRFDKSGTVYQGVCSCTFTNAVLNTLPNAFARDQVERCDIGVVKIDFDIPTVTAASVASPATSGCAPYAVDFQYTGQDATVFEWFFDENGASSTAENPSYTYNDPGTYTVMLVASNELTCNTVDTSFLVIDVLDASSTFTDTILCDPNETIFLDATTTNASYSWQDGSTGSTYTTSGPGTYWVDVSLLNGACTRRDSFSLVLNNSPALDLGPDFTLCDEASYTLDATVPDATGYLWNDGSTSPLLTITSTGIYTVIVFDEEGCAISDAINVIFSTTPGFNLGADTTLCDLSTLDLTPPQLSGATYTWQDGSTESTFTVSDPGTYWVEIDNLGCISSDTIEVMYYAEVFLDIDYNDIQCFGECNGNIDITMSGGNGTLNFLWNTGSTDPDLNDLCAGLYTLTVTDDICNYVLATIEIIEPGPLNFDYTVQDVVCPGDGDGAIIITNVTGGVPPYLYDFGDGNFVTDSILTGQNGGDYNFVLSDANGCTLSEPINIYEPPAITISAGPDQTINLGESVEIEGTVFPFPNPNRGIFWTPSETLSCSTDCVDPIANPVNTTIYTLSVVDSITGCVLTDEMIVNVEKPRNVFIPNVFSPNGDGVNDIFTIYSGKGVRQVIEFRVYNRWGALVYEGKNIPNGDTSLGWDGYFKGKEMNNAVFAWYAEVEFLDDEIILYKGDVTLVR